MSTHIVVRGDWINVLLNNSDLGLLAAGLVGKDVGSDVNSQVYTAVTAGGGLRTPEAGTRAYTFPL